MGFLEEMQYAGLVPNGVSYSTTLQACERYMCIPYAVHTYQCHIFVVHACRVLFPAARLPPIRVLIITVILSAGRFRRVNRVVKSQVWW